MERRRLTRRFYRRDALRLASALLGRILVRITEDGEELAGRIVETEAYLGPLDRAAHTFGGRRSERNASMFLDGGHAYVYFTYGMHHCVNVVADRAETPTACLIRALEPLRGLRRMRRNRSARPLSRPLPERDLCSGPARLCQALEIDRRLDGLDLTRDPRLFLEPGRPPPRHRIVAAPRVGVAYAGEWALAPYRFYVEASPHVSVGRSPGRKQTRAIRR